jgi:hypothetical protein
MGEVLKFKNCPHLGGWQGARHELRGKMSP